MLKLVRNLALSAMVGLGALATAPTMASADSLTIHAGSGGLAVQIRDRDHHRWRGHNRWQGPRFRACTPRQAVHKAGRLGVRHARVQHVSRRNIAVRGRVHGHHVRVIFARAPGCPVIR